MQLGSLGGVEAGGVGIITQASLLALRTSRSLGLPSPLLTRWERRAAGLGDVRRVLRGVALTALVVEGLTAVALTLRFWLGLDVALGTAA